MPIKNYTTEIEASATVATIQQLLSAKGALRTAVEWDGFGKPSAVFFMLDVGGHPTPFRIAPRADRVHRLLKEDPDVSKKYKTEEQAERVAWRIILNYIELVLAYAEMEQADIAQLLLGFGLMKGHVDFYTFLMTQPDGRKLLADHL